MNIERKDEASSPPDRFSNLPQHITHHILSFLPTKDIVKIGILSKTFMSIAKSIPILDFDYRLADLPPEHEFLSYIHGTILGRTQEEEEDVLQKFRISLEDGDMFTDHCIDEAITYAARNNAKELVLTVRDSYTLPATVFHRSVRRVHLSSFSVENLNELIRGSPQLEKLELSFCSGLRDFNLSSNKIKYINLRYLDLDTVKIESSSLEFFKCDSMPNYFDISNCKFLKVISLGYGSITDKWIETTIPQLAFLETIKLYHCEELRIFRVSNNLKEINLTSCKGLEIVQVRVKNLESFEFDTGYHGNSFTGELPNIREVDIGSCKHLKNLKLRGIGIPKQVLQDQVMKLQELHSLDLDLSSFSEKIEIDHKNLKKLHIYTSPGKYLKEREIKIQAPSLVSFRYDCEDIIPLLSFHGEITALHVTLYLNQRDINAQRWYEFIRSFGHCKILTIVNYKGLIFPHDLREKLAPPLIGLKHMRIEVDVESITAELVDTLLWMSPYLETLVFVRRWFGKTLLSLKFDYGMPNKEQEALRYSDHPIKHYSFTTIDMRSEGIDKKNDMLKLFKEKGGSLRSISCRKVLSHKNPLEASKCFYLVA